MVLANVNASQDSLESLLIRYFTYENENLFLEYAEHSKHLIIKLTSDMNILFFNKIAEETYGWDFNSVMGKNYDLLCQNHGFSSPLNDNLNLVSYGVLAQLETHIYHSDVTRKDLHIGAIPISKNNHSNFILIIGKDITEKKKLKEKEQLMGLYLKHIFSYFPAAVWWKDKNSVFQGCNEQCAQFAGISHPDEISGKTDFDLPWEKEAHLYRKDDQEVMATKKPKFSIIEPQRQASGNQVTLCTSKIPLHDSFNNIIGTAGFYYNISEKQCNSLGRLLNDQFKETYTSFQNDKNYYITHGKETVRLTKRQAECLTYISMGKTVKEVSKILDCSPRTIEAHINDLRKKMGAISKSQLAEYFWNNPIKWF